MSGRFKLAAYRAAHDVGNRAVLRFRYALKLAQHARRKPEGEQRVVLHVGHCITTHDDAPRWTLRRNGTYEGPMAENIEVGKLAFDEDRP